MTDHETPTQADLDALNAQPWDPVAGVVAQPLLPLPPRQLRRLTQSFTQWLGEQTAIAAQNDRARAWWAQQRPTEGGGDDGAVCG